MKRFRKILVGIDLAQGDLLVSDELDMASREAIRKAVWLAKINDGELCFFHSLDVNPQTQDLIRHSLGLEPTVADSARAELLRHQEKARAQGVKATSALVFGKSWIELIREVARNRHDIVIVGTRRHGAIGGFIFGSTGQKLLRKCPCPVWVTLPQPEGGISKVLVATDFSPACETALDLGASLAELQKCELHVLHVVEFPDPYLRGLGVAGPDIEKHRELWLNAGKHRFHEHLLRPSVTQLSRKPFVHILEGRASEVIKRQVKELKIDLLAMGTVARSGLSGILVGNTAERILSDVTCSVLGVKPPGFQSPVTEDA